VAPSFGLELRPVDVRDANDIEQLSVAQSINEKPRLLDRGFK
jgi:hypothetical protein